MRPSGAPQDCKTHYYYRPRSRLANVTVSLRVDTLQDRLRCGSRFHTESVCYCTLIEVPLEAPLPLHQ